MKKSTILILVLAAFGAAMPVTAQDLLINNARILDANREVEQGIIIVRDGRIVLVSSGTASANDLPVVDARGMTALPGYIDGHRHIMQGDSNVWLREEAPERMQEYLDAGFTTLMAGGGSVPGIIELKELIDSGELAGPRIVTSGRADPDALADADAARQRVRFLADAGVDIIKARLEEGGQEILRVVTQEAAMHGLEVMVHAVTVPLTIDAVQAGAGKLVHTPTRSLIEETDGARLVADADIPMTSTLGIWVPIYGNANQVQWRDRSPFPDEAWPRAGLGPVNGRRLYDAGVVYAFGTDTSFLPIDSLAHELIPLRLVFSPVDILRIMGPNSAAFVDREDEIGLLQPGMLADIVLVDGDPLEDVHHLLDVQVVIKGGEVVADHRR